MRILLNQTLSTIRKVSTEINFSKQKIRDVKIALQTSKILLTVIFISKSTNTLLFLCIFGKFYASMIEI